MRKSRMEAIATGSFLGFLLTYLTSLIPSVNVDTGLAPVFEKVKAPIENVCKSYNFPNQYEVIFEELKGDEIGVCERKLFNWQIKIDPRIWRHLKEHERLALMVHEVAHCALELDHVPENNHILSAIFPDNLTESKVNFEFSSILMECMTK